MTVKIQKNRGCGMKIEKKYLSLSNKHKNTK